MNDNDSLNLNKRLSDLEEKIKLLTDSVEKINTILDVKDAKESLRQDIPTQQIPDPQPGITPEYQQPIEPTPNKPITEEPQLPPKQETDILAQQSYSYEKVRIPRTRPKQSFNIPEHMKSGEYWLNRIGIALLLFGVAFLFKYSIDNGWLTPWIRVAFGFAVGATVLTLGYRIYNKKRAFATTLLGAGFGIWYITGFSAYQLLELVPHTPAFGFMILVTLSAFSLSLKQDDAILSLIAVIGGFGTPFLLYNSSGNLPGLVIYTSIIIACGLGVYFFKGWRSVLWVTSISSWTIFFIGIASTIPERSFYPLYAKWISQSGVIFAWVGLWLTPFSRELIHIKYPKKWKKTFVGFGDHKLTASAKEILDRHVHVLVVTSPFMGLAMSSMIWPALSSDSWGWIVMGISLVYFAVSFMIRKISEFKTLMYTHLLIAFSLFNFGIVLLLDGNTLLFTLATEAILLQLISKRISDIVISKVGHLIHASVLLWMFYRLVMFSDLYVAGSFFDGQTLTDLWVVATFIAGAIWIPKLEYKRIYGVAAIVTLTAIFIQELTGSIEMFVISSEALAVAFIAKISDEIVYQRAKHFIAGLMFVLMGMHFYEYLHKPEYALNIVSLVNLWSIAVAYLIYKIENNGDAKRAYALGIILTFAMIIIREFTFNVEYALLTLEAGVLLYLTKSSKDNFLKNYCHPFFALLGYWLLARFVNDSLGSSETAMLNWTAAANLWYIAVIAYLSKFIEQKDIQTGYRFAAHIAFLSFLGFELVRLDNGHGWISLSWGIYGIVLLLIGLRMNIQRFRIVGLGTLVLLVGKLFMVDLAKLETIWRVLLFIGFGALFLLLSYFFKPLWKKDNKKPEAKDSLDNNSV